MVSRGWLKSPFTTLVITDPRDLGWSKGGDLGGANYTLQLFIYGLHVFTIMYSWIYMYLILVIYDFFNLYTYTQPHTHTLSL